MRRSRALPAFERSSGNVFRDLGFDDPDEELAKAKLIVKLGDLLAARRLRQTDAARVLGTTQPKISRLLRGFSTGFSTGKLMTLLTRLGQDVDIVVRPVRGRANTARVRVLLPPSSSRRRPQDPASAAGTG